jgi:uncharacterized protein (TIGR00730 family)
MPLRTEMVGGNDPIKDASNFKIIFSTFQARKACMMEKSEAIVVFKGGFGTLDELFEAVTLMQQGIMKKVPIFIYPQTYYKQLLDLSTMLKEHTIDKEDAELFIFCKTKKELINNLKKFVAEYNDTKELSVKKWHKTY